ncbi:MAG TPA: YggT family protein [Gemmatimonadales bacterium]|nr:YggT family protein [Gemmatimonadales bacterium]
MIRITPTESIDLVARTVALAAVGAAGLVALTHWAVRRGHLKPFGPWPRMIRRSTDPILQPLERRLVSLGRNPQDASLWLFGGTLLGGVLLLALTRWVVGVVETFVALARGGPLDWVRFLVSAASAVLMASIVIRVVGHWLGAHRWNRMMRPFYLLTDWLIEPIRKRIHRRGLLDLSPLVAYLLVLVARSVILALLR